MTCALLRIFAISSMMGSCSQLGLLEGVSCRKCNSVSCWPSWLRDQHGTRLLSQQRWTLCELLARKGLTRGGKRKLSTIACNMVFYSVLYFSSLFYDSFCCSTNCCMYKEMVALERCSHEVHVLPREEKKQGPRPYPVKAVGRTLRHNKGQTDYDRERMSCGRVFVWPGVIRTAALTVI